LPEAMSAEEFRARTDVSRETLARLEIYAGLLRRWQSSINLISRSSLEDLWRRHFLDSAQLAPLVEKHPARIVDLGSGAGFPGLVLAVMGAGALHLVESDARKCAFLAEVIRATGAPATLHHARIEALSLPRFEVVTARALAPLDRLLAYAEPHFAANGACLFLKGRRLEEELTQARDRWKMSIELFPSIADPGGTVVRLREIARVRDQRRAP
jgi:16S rRNA (guanine527-N7)-methyltransferase